MASSGYGIPNYGTVSDADVNQLLEQFEDENMLSLRLGSHRAGAGDFDAFADVSESTPSYLQDEDGGLDKDLAARLAALKTPQKDRGKGAASAVCATTNTSEKEEDRKSDFLERKPSEDLPTKAGGEKSVLELGPKDKVGNDRQSGPPVEEVVNEHVKPDPDDVASLGSDLASRLRKLKGGGAPVGANRKDLPNGDVPKGIASEAERYALLQKRTFNRGASDGAVAREERAKEQAAPRSDESAGSTGTPFIDLSRGGLKKQVVEVASRGGAAESWSNPLAGLFGKRRTSTAKSGRALELPAGPTDGPSDLDNTERRARELLAGYSGGGEGAGRNSRKSVVVNGRPGPAAASIDPNSALGQDLRSVRGPPPERVYDQVLKEEQKEQSEVEALLAAMHDDVRIKRERRAPGLEMAAGEDTLSSEEEEEDGSVVSDSELAEGHKKKDKKVDEIAAWAVDAARLEVVGADSDGVAPVAKSRRHNHRLFSSDEDGSMSDYDSSSDSGGRKGRKSVSRKLSKKVSRK